ncbi:DUF3558 domain-containing protein [Streptomyces sp. NPDC059679]|uniref:DUF3558 domain-containing protein n=1 Tax=Streptomyces sp. NPDC059679 TaxID=3346903 RepID=UPI00369215AE
MPQWDADRQDWVTPLRPALPPPGAGPRRPLIVVVAVLVLLVGVVVFLGQQDSDDQAHGRGAPGRGSTPSAPSAAPGASALPDPCAALAAPAAATADLSLDPSAVSTPFPPGRRMCAWTDLESLTFLLDYSTTDIPTSPEPTPTTVHGLQSASVSDSGTAGCTVQWPTSFGKAYVYVSSDDGSSSDLCGEAAAFAAAVAPKVPS